MAVITLEALRENPWNILKGELPENPSPIFLALAATAAEYCVVSEHELMEAARAADYTPIWWRADDICPDAHEECEERWRMALRRYEEIDALRLQNADIELCELGDPR